MSDHLIDDALLIAGPFLVHEEAVVLKPYRDQLGLPTIGVGHRIPTMKHPPITYVQAMQMLNDDMRVRAHDVAALCPALLTEPPHRFAAVLSFAFNAGTGPKGLAGSTLRRKIARKDWAGAAAEFERWVFGHDARGQVVKLAVLEGRRKRERALFEGKGV
jgi:GH24 family phage-related lysozyme (muramidase)